MNISLKLRILGALIPCIISGVLGAPVTSKHRDFLHLPTSITSPNPLISNTQNSFSLFAGVVAPAVTITSTVTGGDWTLGTSWVGGVAPGPGDDVIIAGPVSVNSNVSCNHLTINSGGTLAITGTNKLSVNGNWENNGTFIANSSVIEFIGNTNSTFKGNSITSFFRLKLDKTNGLNNTIEFTNEGAVECTDSITFSKGVLKLISGTLNLNCRVRFTVAKNSGIWIDGATLNTGRYTITNEGLIRISSGTANFGTHSGNSVHTQVDGAFQVTGGNVFIAGRLENSAGGTLATGIPSGITISGGNVTLCTVGNGASSTGSLHVTQNGAFNFTGGTIIFQNGSTATTALDIGLVDGTGNGAKTTIGGTFQLGNSSTPANTTFKINSEIPLYNLTINNASGNNPSVQLVGNDLTISNKLTMNGGNIDAATNSKKVILTNPNITSIDRVSGYITGSFQRTISSTGGVAYDFPVGNGTNYTPLILNFTNANDGGKITVSSNANDPIDLTGTILNYGKSVNNHWVIKNEGVAFTSMGGEFSFPVGIADGGTYNVGIYNGSTWTYPSSTNISATRVSFSNLETLGSNSTFSLAECIPPIAPNNEGNKAICAIETIPTLTVTVASGETADWYSASSGGAAIATGTLTYTPTSAGTYYAEARNTSTGCTSTTRTGVTLTINPNPTAPTSGGSQTICASQTIPALSVSVGAGETADWFSASSGGVAIATGTLTYTPTVAGTFYAEARNTSTGCISTTRTGVTLTINPLPSQPTVTNQTICYNTSTILTVGGAVSGQVFKWYDAAIGGNLIKTSSDHNDANYSTPSLTASTSYWITITNNGTGCESTRSKLDVTVQGQINPGTIAGNQTICNGGNPDPFTSSTPGSGGTGVLGYQWESSTDGSNWTNIVTGGNSAIYDAPAPLNITTFYRRHTIYTLNGTVCSSVTGHLTVVVQEQISGGTITAEQTICEGDTPALLTGNAINPGPGATITYQWQSSATGGAPWTAISGATGKDYQSLALTNDLYYRREVISTLSGNSCSAFSNSVRIYVNNIDPGTILDYQEICLGAIPGTITSSVPATGDGTITYKWQSGTESATGTFTDITPAVTTTTYTPPSPSITTWYRRVATSVLNGKTCSKYTATTTHELYVGIYDPGTIAASDADLNYCAGDNPGNIIGSNQSGAYLSPISFQNYKWQKSNDGITWEDIPSANSKDYDPPAITSTTYFRRIVRVKLKGANFCENPGNIIQMNVFPVPALQDIPTVSVCEGEPFTITATASNTGSGTPIFKLKYISGTYPAGSEPAEMTNSTGIFTLPALLPPLNPIVGQQNFEVTVTNGDAGACPAIKTAIVRINDIPNITLTASCAPAGSTGTITMTGTVSYPAGAVVEYSINNGTSWTTNPIFSNLSIGPYVVLARNSISQTCYTQLSGNINDRNVITTDYEICQGGTVSTGLTGASLCIVWENFKSNAVGNVTTSSSQLYNVSSTINTYTAGALVQYATITIFKTDNTGLMTIKDCPDINGSYSIYEYPFDPTHPETGFVRKITSTCGGGPGNDLSLDRNKVYVIILNSPNQSTSVTTKLSSTTGNKLQIPSTTPGTISWYTTPSGGTSIYTGSTFNPVGKANSGITNTNTPGTWIFYADCGSGACREPAVFTINPIPIGVATKDTICTGTPTNIQLVSKDNAGNIIDPAKVTYTWTASVTNGGTATGFSNCSTTTCGSTITQTITSQNVNVCPVITYVVTPKIGNCTGATFNVEVLVLNNSLINLDPSTPLPPAASYSCLADVPAAVPLKGTHACLGLLTSTVVDTPNSGTACNGSPRTITRTWTFDVECGDVVYTQTITVEDKTLPTFTVPANKTIYINSLCSYDASTTITGDVTDEADDCAPPANFEAQYSDTETAGSCLGSKIITRTWSLTDNCGNTTTKDQIITVEDNTPPSINCNVSQPLTIKADAGQIYATYTLPNPIYADNTEKCSPAGTVSLSWTIVNGASTTPGSGIIPANHQFAIGTNTITYTATDPCGNSTPCSFVITVEPNDPPEIDCPVALSLNTGLGVCTAIATPALPTLSSGTQPIEWTWTITGPGSSVPDASGTFTGSVATPGPPAIGNYQFRLGVSTIKWRAENIAGFEECTQTVTVTDDQPPTFTLPTLASGYCPEDIYQAEYSDAPYPDDLTYPRPDYFLFASGFTMLNLGNVADNCALKSPEPISWTIDFGNDGSINLSGTGQLSTYGSNIQFPIGTNRITYTVTDAAGNTTVQYRDLIVLPRPDITKNF